MYCQAEPDSDRAPGCGAEGGMWDPQAYGAEASSLSLIPSRQLRGLEAISLPKCDFLGPERRLVLTLALAHGQSFFFPVAVAEH